MEGCKRCVLLKNKMRQWGRNLLLANIMYICIHICKYQVNRLTSDRHRTCNVVHNEMLVLSNLDDENERLVLYWKITVVLF